MGQVYSGQCHCGAVKFEVNTDLQPVVRCNCSLCRRKGALMHRTEQENFTLLKGAENLGCYQFHTHKAEHYFCKTCGIYTHHRPRMNPALVGVNVGCLDGVDSALLPDAELIDGASFD
ncbi:GFA family protein [Aliamphritea spongicola]|uniref:GFA family protein n=1 Tax=Aliamphritea spongicola TaxID=707589 RepID=UPI00196B9A72|nr:GFA family protein [Aliamphritea spongicola]MBN3563329.1 GFA family protein [Aliamphritea spongicola]